MANCYDNVLLRLAYDLLTTTSKQSRYSRLKKYFHSTTCIVMSVVASDFKLHYFKILRKH